MLQRWSEAVQYRVSSAAGVEKIALMYGPFMQPGLVLAPRGTTHMAFSSAADREGTHLGVGQEQARCGGVSVFFAFAAGYGLRSSTAIVYSVLFLCLACRRAWRTPREWVLRSVRHGFVGSFYPLILLVPCVAAAYYAAAGGKVSPPL